jgi:hypothetical protein
MVREEFIAEATGLLGRWIGSAALQRTYVQNRRLRKAT